jgi:general secretion pathway protein H
MRTSAAGNNTVFRGFTLLELIVVIAIIAMSTVAVSLAMRDSHETQLDREAERLTALLESARAQSRTSGVAVRWRPVANGFVFDGLPPEALPGVWLAEGMSAQAATSDGTPEPALLIGPEPIIPAQQVIISFAGPPLLSRRLATDGLRPFAIVPEGQAP